MKQKHQPHPLLLPRRPALGSLARALVRAGRLSEDEAARRTTAGHIAAGLVGDGVIEGAALAGFICHVFGYPLLDLNALDRAALPRDMLPRELLERGCLAIGQRGAVLTIAVADPTDSDLMEAIRARVPGLSIEAVVVAADSLAAAVRA